MLHTHTVTPLIFASGKGDIEVAKLLIDAQADLEKTMGAGFTALFVSSQEGNIKMISCLKQRVNHASLAGVTPLHYATQNGDLGVMQVLLAAKAHVDKARCDGTTPLMTAAIFGNEQVVETLLAHGADRSLTKSLQHPKKQVDAMQIAVMRGHVGCVKLFAPNSTEADLDMPSKLKELMSPGHEMLRIRACAGCGRMQALNDGFQFKKCARCGKPRYCQRSCQVKHWKEAHQHECKGRGRRAVSCKQYLRRA